MSRYECRRHPIGDFQQRGRPLAQIGLTGMIPHLNQFLAFGLIQHKLASRHHRLLGQG